jgi:hypothetical protein
LIHAQEDATCGRRRQEPKWRLTCENASTRAC